MLLSYEGANQAYAWFSFWVKTLRHGSLPLWDPYTFSGHAFSGEMQTGAFYPLYGLFLLKPLKGGMFSEQLYHYFYVFTHILCAYFMYRLLRTMHRSVYAGLVSGICFSLGGFVVRLNGWPHLLESAIWLPLIFNFLLQALKSSSVIRLVTYSMLGGLSLAMSVLAGGLHLAIMQAIVICSATIFYAASADYGEEASRRNLWIRSLLSGTVCLTFGLAGGAVQLLPSAEYSHRAIRFLAGTALPATEKIPYAYLGDALWPHSILGMIVGAFSGNASSGEYISPYFGVFSMLLAAIGTMKYWDKRWVRYLAGLALLSFLYSFGNFSLLHGILYALAPILWMAREADRFVYLADFALAILAGFGADALLSSKRPLLWGQLPRALCWMAISAMIALAYPVVAGKGDMNPWISLSLILIVLSYCLFGYIIRGHNGPWAKFLILALIVFDLSAFDWSAANRLQESAKRSNYMEQLRSSSAVASFVRAQPGVFRVEVEGELVPDIGDVYGVEMTMGNAVTLVADYKKMRQYLDLLNVRYQLKPASTREPGAVYQDSEWQVFENHSTFPRGWLVHETVVERDTDSAFRRLDSPGVDLHHVAIVSAPAEPWLPPAPPDISNECVSVHRPSANRLEIDVRSSRKALLVLSELYYPGWRATVDKHATPVQRVDGALRGIIVPSGISHVSVCYQPMSFYLGMISSLCSFLCGGMILLLQRTNYVWRLSRLRDRARRIDAWLAIRGGQASGRRTPAAANTG